VQADRVDAVVVRHEDAHLAFLAGHARTGDRPYICGRTGNREGARWPAVGRIHFAGTETAGVSHGAIDGAVRSGERVAQEILALAQP